LTDEKINFISFQDLLKVFEKPEPLVVAKNDLKKINLIGAEDVKNFIGPAYKRWTALNFPFHFRR
jgi:hypothetical protein